MKKIQSYPLEGDPSAYFLSSLWIQKVTLHMDMTELLDKEHLLMVEKDETAEGAKSSRNYGWNWWCPTLLK